MLKLLELIESGQEENIQLALMLSISQNKHNKLINFVIKENRSIKNRIYSIKEVIKKSSYGTKGNFNFVTDSLNNHFINYSLGMFYKKTERVNKYGPKKNRKYNHLFEHMRIQMIIKCRKEIEKLAYKEENYELFLSQINKK